MKTTIISSKQLGTNCWLPARFTGGECKRLDECKYLEKKTCKAHVDHTIKQRTYAINSK